jgi:hypothetical protein
MGFHEGSEKPDEILVISALRSRGRQKMVISIMALMMMAQEQLHYLKLLKHSKGKKKTVMDLNVPSCFACNG